MLNLVFRGLQAMNTLIEDVVASIRERLPDKLSSADIQSLLRSDDLSRLTKRYLLPKCDKPARIDQVCAEFALLNSDIARSL